MVNKLVKSYSTSLFCGKTQMRARVHTPASNQDRCHCNKTKNENLKYLHGCEVTETNHRASGCVNWHNHCRGLLSRVSQARQVPSPQMCMFHSQVYTKDVRLCLSNKSAKVFVVALGTIAPHWNNLNIINNTQMKQYCSQVLQKILPRNDDIRMKRHCMEQGE